MAIDLEDTYPGKVNPASPAWPFGQPRNITIPGDGTGTPWEQSIIRDTEGFKQALLTAAGLTPSGVPDTAQVSQYLQSLVKISGVTVGTVAEMKNLTGVAQDAEVSTLVYASVGDGGGGTYRADPSDNSSTDNKGTVIVGNDGTRYKLKHNGIIHIAQWGNDFAAAVDNMPDNGVLLLGETPVIANFEKERSNLSIRGCGMPWPNAGLTALEGGSVIQGKCVLDGDNLSLQDLGVDAGSDVCAALTAGAATDALVLHDLTLSANKTNNRLENVYGLVKEPSSPFHAILFEGQVGGTLDNVYGRHGNWGIVIKGQRIQCGDLYAFKNTSGGVTIKSDSYAVANKVNVANIHVDDEGAGCDVGAYIYAATAQIEDINIGNIYVKGCDVPFKMVCSPRSPYTYPGARVNVSNLVLRDGATFGLETFGAWIGVNLDNIVIADTVSGKSIKVDDNALDFHIGTAICSAPAALGSVPSDAVYLGGRTFFESITSVKGFDLTLKQAIQVVPDVNRIFGVGHYVGILNLNRIADGVSYTLPNGWTTAFGDTPQCIVRNGGVYMTGRVAVPGTPWTGKEKVFDIPVNAAPKTHKNFMIQAFNGSTSATVPVYVEVTTGGAVNIALLNTAGNFPAAITWVGLDGISYQLDEVT